MAFEGGRASIAPKRLGRPFSISFDGRCNWMLPGGEAALPSIAGDACDTRERPYDGDRSVDHERFVDHGMASEKARLLEERERVRSSVAGS
ncbi:hypothetical protein SAMN04489712_1413 [Thermomonospora echinospora]|uniref:Uncharacterized protein n=1 Tax=Thermomonospora echinospora TaxID=1992 RepID=A0A1H6E986_9ACTN|nr:hypothetical protein SAMN04489712_1413 [Thermomonospora echinospora]